MGLKEEWAKVNALRNCDTQLLGRRDEPANEHKRRTQTGERKAENGERKYRQSYRIKQKTFTQTKSQSPCNNL